MNDSSDELHAPVGTLITGQVQFLCQEVIGRNGDLCARLVTLNVERDNLVELQDKIDDDLHRRCENCRRVFERVNAKAISEHEMPGSTEIRSTLDNLTIRSKS